MPAAILRAAKTPLCILEEVVEAIGDAIDGAITGAAIGWLERRGYRVTPGDQQCLPSS